MAYRTLVQISGHPKEIFSVRTVLIRLYHYAEPLVLQLVAELLGQLQFTFDHIPESDGRRHSSTR